MKIYDLGSVAEADLEASGGKARGLDKLIRDGFNVPHGFVLIDVDVKSNLDAA